MVEYGRSNEDEMNGSKAIEEFWVKNQLPKEVESLPYDILNKQEQYIIDKIREGQELTQEEIDIIKKTRKEWEEPLKKYDANEIIKSNEMLYDAMGTEQELLDFVYGQAKQTIVMNLPINGVTKQFTFTVKPLEDSRAVKMLEQHIDIFQDLSNEERNIYLKYENGEHINEKERRVLEHIQNKINENRTISQLEEITTFLAWQLEEPKSLSLEEKIEFWKQFNFMHRMALYGRVMDKLGLNQEFNEKLFQD
ncbi:MAG: hypothetical protein J6Y78_10980 [Paludibacteraceae bacterium]|nr:hypothetical protein [Paludibacteraceae bacterium]